MASFFTVGPVPQAAERARTRMWARFKAGTLTPVAALLRNRGADGPLTAAPSRWMRWT